MRECAHCSGRFMLPNINSYNGLNLWLCTDCAQSVKHCKRCRTTKSRSEFVAAKDKAHGLAAHCRECQAAEWAALPRTERRRAKLRLRGLTHEQFEAMRVAQGDLCAICKNPETDLHRTASGVVRELSIDHDHKTGAVRSLLCGRCNKAIGLMLDDPERLIAAAEYLQSWATPPLQL